VARGALSRCVWGAGLDTGGAWVARAALLHAANVDPRTATATTKMRM